MLEVLDYVRRDFEIAHTAFDGEQGSYLTLENVQEKYDRFTTLHAAMTNEQTQIKQRFVFMGAILAEIRRDKLYHVVRQDKFGTTGYSNFYVFCQDVFGFKKTTVINILSVYDAFCQESGMLSVEYINFSYSQLVELACMEKYRERIPVTTSVRDIKRLRDLYKNYDPKPGTTIKDDLEEWRRREEENKREKNAKKNAINFVPAKKTEGQTSDHFLDITSENAEHEDDRDLSTPDVGIHISEDQVIKGLLRQLNLLSQNKPWQKLCNIVTEVLETKTPTKIASYHDLVRAKLEIIELKKKLSNGQTSNHGGIEVHTPKSGEKLNLKNAKARQEWLENYEAWGVWLKIPQVDRTFYRYDLINGTSIVVEVGYTHYDYASNGFNMFKQVKYSLLDEKRKIVDIRGYGGASGIVDWLTKHAKEI